MVEKLLPSLENLSNEVSHNSENEQTREFVGIYLGGGKLKSGQYKASVEFDGTPTAARVVDVFQETSIITRIVAIVPDESLITPYVPNLTKGITFYKSGETFFESIKTAFDSVEDNEDVIVVLSDVPFLRKESIERLAKANIDSDIIVPAVAQIDVERIAKDHNLHFSPSKEGYFHLGNMVLLRKGIRNKVDLDRLAFSYADKSFRTNPRAKLEAAYGLMGREGLAIAIRIWISANLQHKNMQELDKLLPSPSLEAYSRVLSRIFNSAAGIMVDNFADTFLDYDYPDDAELLQRNFSNIEEFLRSK